MNKITDFLQRYLVLIAVLIGISILLSVTFSSFIVTSNDHKAAEMYIGALKYSIEIDGTTTNTLTVPTGETIIDVKVNNLNPVDTYYKLLYLKNTNIIVKYYESTKNTDDVVTTYNKPNDSITSSNSNTIKLLITNSSTSSQNIALTMKGGYITNTIQDIVAPSTYSEITLVETPSTNTYFCKTSDTLTNGLEYVNGQYTYGYKKEGYYASSGLSWNSISNNGWGVQLTDKTSTDAVTSKLCTYINNKSVISMRYMFYNSQATTLDLSSFDTSKVTDMRYMFNNSKATTLDVSNFDTSKVTNMSGMFYESQATTLDLSNFDSSNVTDMSWMFYSSNATTIDVSNFNTSKVTDMSGMFAGSKSTILDVSNFDTSKVTDMHNMFYSSQAKTLDLSSFDTSKVTDMTRMFADSQATKLDLSSFNTSNVTNMSGMFYESQATTLDLSNFDSSNVTDMSWMFYSSNATTIDVSNFNTSKVTDMSGMFAGSKSTILDVSNFDTSKVTDMHNMFYSSQAKTLDLSSFDTSKVTNMSWMFSGTASSTMDVSKFNTSNVTSMEAMFQSSQATTLDVSNFDTSKVTKMGYMFSGTAASTIDVSKFNTSNVTSMEAMFQSSQAATLDVSNFDTSNVTNMGRMFANCLVTTLDLSSFNTRNVTNMSAMFYRSKATTLDVSKFNTSNVTSMEAMFQSSQAATLDVSNFDTSNVTNMGRMFANCLVTTLDLSSFNTRNVTNMSAMFYRSKATTLDVSKFNTSNVTSMEAMFQSSQAATLDVSNFDTSKVTDMKYMFYYSSNLKTIYASDKFNTDAVTNSTSMFSNSTKLVGGSGTTYNSSYTDKTYARIDGGTSSPGYFTDIADKDIPAPSSFSTDSWKTIIKAVKNNNVSKYSVGDTKEIDLGDTYGTHTLRIANKSTPSSCSTSGYSQTACGFVIEFADIITKYNMNPAGTYKNVEYKYGWNKDGWPASAMRTFVNNDIYNSLPSDLRNGIVETTVVSGYGSSDSANFTSTDKLYLLSPMEVWGDWTGMYGSEVDRSKNQTRQLDYYSNLGVTYKNYNSAIKKYGTSQYFWWHRSAKYDNNIGFYGMQGNGYAYRDGGVSPAFKVG